ncbi:hypothetical protein GIB67_038782 [Kingdonia uniflora]|uniref:LAZY1 n=1 Tax=Kingdonia uniflora TaxID=39325 RepID=A0A7J7M0Q2_9MAGN|nr:hypothetical protein GIB67_038782 [Kingdonia uniflora]
MSGNSCYCISGQSSMDEQQYSSQSSYNSTKHIQNAIFLPKSFTGLESMRRRDADTETEETGDLYHDIFAIGTLGFDPALISPETQAFAFSVENVMEKETEATEKDFKLINEELEKVLSAEAEEDKYNNSSGRTSRVSNVHRLSGADAAGNRSTVCPLQGYLFGSPIELQETTMTIKEARTSLGELFQKSKIAEEKGHKEMNKEGNKNVKKTPKRQMLKNYISAAATSDSVLTRPKLNKILKMFHKKVHPEITTTSTKNPSKPNKKEHKNIGCYDNGGGKQPEEDIMLFPQGASRGVGAVEDEVCRMIWVWIWL